MGGGGGDEKGNCNQAWVKSIQFTDTSKLILIGTQANVSLQTKIPIYSLWGMSQLPPMF